MSPTAYRYGDLIKRCRQERGLSQRQLSVLVGLPPSRLSAYETHRRTPTVEVVNTILSGLDLQLALRAEARFADIDAIIAAGAGLSSEQRLSRFGDTVSRVATLFVEAEPMVDGAAGALLLGVPITVSCVDLRVGSQHAAEVMRILHRERAERWSEHWKDFDDRADRDPRSPGSNRWRAWLGEFRLHLIDEPIDPISVSVPVRRRDNLDRRKSRDDVSEVSFKVVPLDRIGALDAEQARLVDRVIERSRAWAAEQRQSDGLELQAAAEAAT